MEQPAGSSRYDRRLIGRVIVAVILGEAIWALIVSVMNNLIVPWLGDVMGQSSGLPTSFVQRPYNYPELFVSILEVCIAGLVAAILNYFVQRPQGPGAPRIKSVKSAVPAGPVRMFPDLVKAPTPPEVSINQAPPPPAFQNQIVQDVTPRSQPVVSAVSPAGLASEIRAEPVAASTPVAVAPAPPVSPAPELKAVSITPPLSPPVVAQPVRPVTPSPKAVPAKAKKPKEVYYNIVGEPMPSDDD